MQNWWGGSKQRFSGVAGQHACQPITPRSNGRFYQVKVGEIAIAIGNPYGLSGTMTEGIISGLSRTLPVGLDSSSTQQGPTYSIPDIIQTDAAINPGNSGGVLVNTEGQLIGVTAAIRSPVDANSGIGFVIPSAIVSHVSCLFDPDWKVRTCLAGDQRYNPG